MASVGTFHREIKFPECEALNDDSAYFDIWAQRAPKMTKDEASTYEKEKKKLEVFLNKDMLERITGIVKEAVDQSSDKDGVVTFVGRSHKLENWIGKNCCRWTATVLAIILRANNFPCELAGSIKYDHMYVVYTGNSNEVPIYIDPTWRQLFCSGKEGLELLKKTPTSCLIGPSELFSEVLERYGALKDDDRNLMWKTRKVTHADPDYSLNFKHRTLADENFRKAYEPDEFTKFLLDKLTPAELKTLAKTNPLEECEETKFVTKQKLPSLNEYLTEIESLILKMYKISELKKAAEEVKEFKDISEKDLCSLIGAFLRVKGYDVHFFVENKTPYLLVNDADEVKYKIKLDLPKLKGRKPTFIQNKVFKEKTSKSNKENKNPSSNVPNDTRIHHFSLLLTDQNYRADAIHVPKGKTIVATYIEAMKAK